MDSFDLCKGWSTFIIIFTYDIIPIVREGGTTSPVYFESIPFMWENDDDIVRGGGGSESYDRNYHKWKWW